MNKQEITPTPEVTLNQGDVRYIAQNLTILSNHVNTITYTSAWQFIQFLPSTHPLMTSKLEKAVQLIKEASAIFLSAYDEYETNDFQPLDIPLDDGDLVTDY